jgi:hypothetical protein
VGMHIKLNVHNEEFVFDASIAFLITCTQWMMVLWCMYCIHGYMDIVKVINSKMWVLQL